MAISICFSQQRDMLLMDHWQWHGNGIKREVVREYIFHEIYSKDVDKK